MAVPINPAVANDTANDSANDSANDTAWLHHPSAPSWQPDRLRMARRFADVLAAAGVPCPEVAAAAVAARSCTGLDRRTFARSLGVADTDLVAVESGRCPVDQLPPQLADGAYFLRILAALRPLRLVRPHDGGTGQSRSTATDTGRPAVTVSNSSNVVRNTAVGVPAAAQIPSRSRRPSSISTGRPAGRPAGLTPPIG